MALKVLWIKILFFHACKNRYRGAFNARVYASRTVSCFLATNMPIHYFRSKTHVFEGFAPFRRCTRPVAETRIGVHLIECCFFQNSRTLDILLERFQCTPLGPKLTFWVFAHHFGALKCQFGFAPHTLRLNSCFRWSHAISLSNLTHCENQYRVH